MLRKVLASLGVLTFLFVLVTAVFGVTALYNQTVRIVSSTGTVLGGVASATTALYNSTVQVVDSTGHVIDSFGGGAGGSNVTSPITGDGSAGTPLACPTCQTTGAGLDSSGLAQNVFTQAGSPLFTFTGQTFGASQTLLNWTLPANTIGITGLMKCHWYGDIQNNTGGSINYSWQAYNGAKFLNTGALAETTSVNYHPWSIDTVLMNGGASNVNSYDGQFFIGTASGILGTGAAISPLEAGISLAAITTGSSAAIQLQMIVGSPTPAATPTVAPTAATTPITHLYGVNCWRLPSYPTQTPTPSPTPT